jgi:hypothetical protein
MPSSLSDFGSVGCKAAAALLLLVAGAVHAEGAGRWWLGFIDQAGRAFLEIPAEPRGCAERDRLVARLAPEPGIVLVSPRPAASLVPQGARLAFGVTDLDGNSTERVFARVAAIVREDERGRASLQQACLFLVEAGADRPGHRALEDRLAIGVHPPRPLQVTRHDDGWRSFGGTPGVVGADKRFLAEAEAPGWARDLVRKYLPGASQFHVQPFSAVLSAGAVRESLWLIGGIQGGELEPADPGAYNTINLIVGETAAGRRVYFQSGPSGGLGRDRAGSFVAQVAATLDLDGDGIDEVLVRARHYAGGSLMVLRRAGSGFAVVRKGGYEGE